jgi:2-oxoglutarate ferredoxin oxidoreductase subunit alpha
MAVYAGHGEFPRIILAPGTLEDGFCLTQRAFDLADKYQVPVFILTDQYYIDSYYSTPVFELSRSGIEKHVVSTSRDYRRYELVATGVSPRGVPGYGEGLVVVDSDEHDEEGHITEDAELRVRMVGKRLAKGESLIGDAVPPELVGPPDYRSLVICWGSTYHAVKEAVSRLERDDTAMLHYRQVYPVPADTTDYLRRAERTVIVEGNATAQFRRLIQLQTGISVMHQVLSYDGLGFSVERIIDRLGDILA